MWKDRHVHRFAVESFETLKKVTTQLRRQFNRDFFVQSMYHRIRLQHVRHEIGKGSSLRGSQKLV